jgi:hypothetical protein
MTIEEQFQAFHATNPWVYTELARLAREALKRGRQKIGIGMVYEVVRWNRFIQTRDPNDDTWKLNNNYRSRYARLLMAQEADLKDLFETRELQSP